MTDVGLLGFSGESTSTNNRLAPAPPPSILLNTLRLSVFLGGFCRQSAVSLAPVPAVNDRSKSSETQQLHTAARRRRHHAHLRLFPFFPPHHPVSSICCCTTVVMSWCLLFEIRHGIDEMSNIVYERRKLHAFRNISTQWTEKNTPKCFVISSTESHRLW